MGLWTSLVQDQAGADAHSYTGTSSYTGTYSSRDSALNVACLFLATADKL